MIKILLLICLLPVAIANAVVSDRFQMDSSAPKSNIKVTKDPIVFNPKVDDLAQLDPRVKSVITYARLSNLTVYIELYSPDNAYYAKQLKNQFINSKVSVIGPKLIKSVNLVNQGLIRVYLLDNEGESDGVTFY